MAHSPHTDALSIPNVVPIEPTKSMPHGSNEIDTQMDIPIPQPATSVTITRLHSPNAPDNSDDPGSLTAPSTTASLPLPNLSFLPQAHYEILLAAIPAHARRVKTAPQAYRHRPATLLSRYWERLQGAAERLAAAEEKRIRIGAKALARGVVAKAWKDAAAVSHSHKPQDTVSPIHISYFRLSGAAYVKKKKLNKHAKDENISMRF
jgi:hypothetical protein